MPTGFFNIPFKQLLAVQGDLNITALTNNFDTLSTNDEGVTILHLA
jgi:hypothetical protein